MATFIMKCECDRSANLMAYTKRRVTYIDCDMFARLLDKIMTHIVFRFFHVTLLY